MDYLRIVLSSVISLVVLFVLAKLIGNRQMSQLTLFDYINGITIGSIAAEMATELDRHWTYPLLAMVIYGALTAFISYVCCKSQTLRRFLNGRTLILYSDGKFRFDNFKKARLDINEFMTQCRISGYFDMSQIETAVMEQNGKISFLPAAATRPISPKDMGHLVPESQLSISVILDGVMLEQNLMTAGYDKKKLLTEMSKAGITDLQSVMLATVDGNGVAVFYAKHTSKDKNDIFM